MEWTGGGGEGEEGVQHGAYVCDLDLCADVVPFIEEKETQGGLTVRWREREKTENSVLNILVDFGGQDFY